MLRKQTLSILVVSFRCTLTSGNFTFSGKKGREMCLAILEWAICLLRGYTREEIGHLPPAWLYQGRNGPFASCAAIPGKKSFREKSFLKLFFPVPCRSVILVMPWVPFISLAHPCLGTPVPSLLVIISLWFFLFIFQLLRQACLASLHPVIWIDQTQSNLRRLLCCFWPLLIGLMRIQISQSYLFLSQCLGWPCVQQEGVVNWLPFIPVPALQKSWFISPLSHWLSSSLLALSWALVIEEKMRQTLSLPSRNLSYVTRIDNGKNIYVYHWK